MQLLVDPAWLVPAREPSPVPPEAHQLDFWIGEWELTWDGGSTRNVIQPILGHRAILESFDGGEDVDLRGISVSSWDPLRSGWVQLWVDNNGGVFELRGGPRDTGFELRTGPATDGSVRRMRFSDITDDGLHWEWSRRGGGDNDFRPLWEVRYRRLV
jgi:hypothetical protein